MVAETAQQLEPVMLYPRFRNQEHLCNNILI